MNCFNPTAASKDNKVSNHCDWLSRLCSELAVEADAVCFVSQKGHVIRGLRISEEHVMSYKTSIQEARGVSVSVFPKASVSGRPMFLNENSV